MDLGERFPVRPEKVEALKRRIAELGIRLDLIEEEFLKGGGKGGQKINKTSSAVRLRYAPLELAVRCQKERSRSLNRFLALRELVEKISEKLVPGSSRAGAAAAAARKRKARRRARAKRKHAS